MVQKHFIDIEHLREEDVDFRKSNTGLFKVGDHIQISEKLDGANACICYNSAEDYIAAFSRKRKLSYDNTLRGFWNFSQSISPDGFKAHPNWRVFGEWLVKNKIVYDESRVNKWYVYDIYDVSVGAWLPQATVKMFCDKYGFEYIHVLYDGPFISWGHCKTFLNSPFYGDTQEGVVVKNQSALNHETMNLPFYLKIVNDEYKETKKIKTGKHSTNEAEKAERDEALRIADAIVTLNRVEKEIFKMINEGILPEQLNSKDMSTIAKFLPKRIHEDCVKEEPEFVIKAGKYFSKACNQLTMKHAKSIVIGG